jgi:hypothetical protein
MNIWRNGGVLCVLGLVMLLLFGSGACRSEPGPINARQGMTVLSQVRDAERRVASARRRLSEIRAGSDPDPTPGVLSNLIGDLSMLATLHSWAGQGDAAVATFNERQRLWGDLHGDEFTGDLREDLEAIFASQTADAVETIALAAAQRQIVVLNELHHVPYHRAFALRLARRLRRDGFQFLACETFRGDDQEVMSRPYATRSTGVYSREPVFAQFLADARQDGWKFVSYEPDSTFSNREFGMAANIVDRVFGISPDARIFIYVGYSHARKLPVATDDDSPAKMAAHLKRLTGIDPLTIDQTVLHDHYFSEAQSVLYRAAKQKISGVRPVVLVDSEGEPTKLTGAQAGFDFHVAHAPYGTDARTRRPEWMTSSEVFYPFPIPSDLIPAEGVRLLYAFPRNSGNDAVPLDLVLLRPGEPAPTLMLISDQYELAHEDISE